MKRFLLRLILFGAIVAGILSMLTAFTDLRLGEMPHGRMRYWKKIREGAINADVVILGSSHAHVQVNPRLLGDVFPGKKIYNLGIEGYAFEVQRGIYNLYRRFNKAPAAIIVCADYMEFGSSKWQVDRTQFLPFLGDTSLRNALLKAGLERPRAVLPLLKYYGESNALLAAVTGKSPLHDDGSERIGWDGFEPMNTHWDEQAFISDTALAHFKPAIDSNCWNTFRQFLEDCRRQSIAVYVVFTPHETRFTQKMQGADAYRAWLRARIMPLAQFIDCSAIPLSGDTGCFYNGTHLNAKGADIFSALLADSIGRIK